MTGTGGALRRAQLDSLGDHRMAMASAVAALAAPPGERSLVTGFGAVETSYPRFADDLASLAAGPTASSPAARGHRRPGRRRQVHRLDRGGRAPRARPARHRRHVPGHRRGCPRPGDRGRRCGRGGGAGRGRHHRGRRSACSSTGRTSPGRSARPTVGTRRLGGGRQSRGAPVPGAAAAGLGRGARWRRRRGPRHRLGGLPERAR